MFRRGRCRWRRSRRCRAWQRWTRSCGWRSGPGWPSRSGAGPAFCLAFAPGRGGPAAAPRRQRSAEDAGHGRWPPSATGRPAAGREAHLHGGERQGGGPRSTSSPTGGGQRYGAIVHWKPPRRRMLIGFLHRRGGPSGSMRPVRRQGTRGVQPEQYAKPSHDGVKWPSVSRRRLVLLNRTRSSMIRRRSSSRGMAGFTR